MTDNRAAAISDLYERLADQYISDRLRVPWNGQPWLDRFLDGVTTRRSVLDLGCGAGAPIGKYLLDHGCAITGIDTSKTLIHYCREHSPRARWIVADMRQLSLGQKFDGLIAWDSFFHLNHADQREMFPVFREHAAPDALLLFTSGTMHGEAIGEYHGEPLYHASLAPLEYESLLAENGFTVLAYVPEDPACGEHTIWLARRTS
ncbi:MAG TPA: class I SAM-dependent methyltransferase [Rhodanobacteraceae bacterium]|nr:class I SAM-dependent methyltransferase [Rhodanobacteraceae bacterium]